MTFKTNVINVEGIGKVEVRELSALGEMELVAAGAADDEDEDSPVEAQKRMYIAMATCAKYGAPQYREQSIEQILDECTREQLRQISDEVLELSDLSTADDLEGNSESIPIAASSSP